MDPRNYSLTANNLEQQTKILFPKVILYGFLSVTVKILDSYMTATLSYFKYIREEWKEDEKRMCGIYMCVSALTATYKQVVCTIILVTM